MSYSLQIDGPVPTWDELGGYAAHNMRDMAGRYRLEGAFLDPLTGVLSGYPLYSYPDEVTADWTFDTAANWTVKAVDQENRADCLFHKATASWTATRAAKVRRGRGFSLFFSLVPVGGGDNDTLTLDFGLIWRLIITESEETELLRWNGAAWVTQELFTNIVPSVFDLNRLLIYQVGPWIVVKNWAALESGFIWLDTAPVIDGQDRPHALRRGAPVVYGTGRAYLGFRPQQWVSPAKATLADNVSLMGPTQQDATTQYFHWIYDPDAVTIAANVYDQAGGAWAAGAPSKTGFSYDVEITSTNSAETAFIGYIGVNIPRTLRTSGTSSVDLASIASVVDVELVENLDPGGARLTARVKDSLTLSSYIKPDMRLDFSKDGTSLFTGLLEQPEREVIGPQGMEALVLSADAARRLYAGSIFDFAPQDGLAIETAITNTIKAAAIPAGDITVPSIGYILPAGDPVRGAALLPGPGDSPGQFLDLLMEYVAEYRWRGKPDFDYDLVLRTLAGGSVATFYRSSAAAVSAGVPKRKVRAWQEGMDGTGYANVVAVVGQRLDKVPIWAYLVNWTAIRNEPPYLPIILLIVDEQLLDQSTVNWVCRKAFDRVSVKRVRAQFRSVYVAAAGPGATVTVDGYGTYRVLSRTTRFNARLQRDGDSAYEVEKL